MIPAFEIASICQGKSLQLRDNYQIKYLATDSRKAIASQQTLFFAIDGHNHDGHDFIESLYNSGVRNFVIEKEIEFANQSEANFIIVKSSIHALQKLVTFHRSQFSYPVIGVTGSNGKTIIKEWLFQVLSPEYNCIKNPGSYNSQLGVPLSVWQMEPHHNMAVFEAGISQPGEMEKLADIIRPTIGIFANIGSAHDEGFNSLQQKISEKAKLFEHANAIIYCKDHSSIDQFFNANRLDGQKMVSWGQSTDSNIVLKYIKHSEVSTSGDFGTHVFHLPLGDRASAENIFHIISTMFYLGYPSSLIQQRINNIKAVPMRLEMKQGINDCQIIDDTYNNDLGGFRISLDFLTGINQANKTVILSDILQSGLSHEKMVDEIMEILRQNHVTKFIGVGPVLSSKKKKFDGLNLNSNFYLSVEDFVTHVNWNDFSKEVILVKGARTFEFEKIVNRLQKKIHGTVLEIDLHAVAHNLNYFRTLLKPNVKLVVMVKAFAYGSGSVEIANLLEYHRVDYLGVAYPDEGMDLRLHGIKVPIMVMNPMSDSFPVLYQHQLEPEIYSLSALHSFATFLAGRTSKIHLKLDTGMHRLGLEEFEMDEVLKVLEANPNIRIASIFTHLAGSENQDHDRFTQDQISLFKQLADRIKAHLKIDPLLHALNSGGILRFPDFQFQMVRLGVGLYGIDPGGKQSSKLKPVASLKTTVSQVRKVPGGQTIGYGRAGKASEEMRVATIAIGYADGYSRQFGNGKGSVMIHGGLAPVIGNVCMDMTMVDVSKLDEVKEGDEVIIFGEDLPVDQVAQQIQTIPYELLTNTSDRVKRVFFAESI